MLVPRQEAEAAQGEVEVPHHGVPDALGVLEQVVVVAEGTEVTVQVRQGVVEGEHPKGFVDVEYLAQVAVLIGDGPRQVDQFGPAVVGFFEFVGAFVADRVRPDVLQRSAGAGGAGRRPVLLVLRVALEEDAVLGTEIGGPELLVHALREVVEAEIIAVHRQLGVVAAGGHDVVARNGVTHRLAQVGRVAVDVRELQRPVLPLHPLAVVGVAHLDVEGQLFLVLPHRREVARIALQTHAHAVKTHAVHAQGGRDAVAGTVAFPGVQLLLPVGVVHFQFHLHHVAQVVEITSVVPFLGADAGAEQNDESKGE